jgi:hypothetical protein
LASGALGQHSCDFSDLLPELSQWNYGKGIDPENWIRVRCQLRFWPKFVPFDGYVVRDGFSLKSLRGFETKTNDRSSVEAVMKHIHLFDIHYHAKVNESQFRYLGRVLKDIYELKLRQDFPDTRFTVDFNDEDGLDLVA